MVSMPKKSPPSNKLYNNLSKIQKRTLRFTKMSLHFDATVGRFGLDTDRHKAPTRQPKPTRRDLLWHCHQRTHGRSGLSTSEMPLGGNKHLYSEICCGLSIYS